MWLFTTQGFYSVVEDRDDPRWLLVRARTREDLAALGSQVEGLEVFESADADYRWRARLLREEWLAAIAQLVHAVDYPNFKEQSPNARDLAAPRSIRRCGWSCVGLADPDTLLADR